tara:strand:- start:263 stop:394 length:132 start_codon:yes stop_codon:yes gene_type:complete
MKTVMSSLGPQRDLKDLKDQENPRHMLHKLQLMMLEKKPMNKV